MKDWGLKIIVGHKSPTSNSVTVNMQVVAEDTTVAEVGQLVAFAPHTRRELEDARIELAELRMKRAGVEHYRELHLKDAQECKRLRARLEEAQAQARAYESAYGAVREDLNATKAEVQCLEGLVEEYQATVARFEQANKDLVIALGNAVHESTSIKTRLRKLAGDLEGGEA